MSNGTPTTDPKVYTPTEEAPDVLTPKPAKFPLSSAPLPEGVTPESVKKSTPAVQ